MARGRGHDHRDLSGQEIEYDVVKPTSARIDGPDPWAAGLGAYVFVPLAGERELDGVRTGSTIVDWTLEHDCDGVATFAPIAPVLGTDLPDATRSLNTITRGTCTIHASSIGVAAA